MARHKLYKRIIAMLLSMFMIAGMMPLGVWAETIDGGCGGAVEGYELEASPVLEDMESEKTPDMPSVDDGGSVNRLSTFSDRRSMSVTEEVYTESQPPTRDIDLGQIYANGTPVVIKSDGSNTNMYTSDGSTIIFEDISDSIIHGGFHTADYEGDTSITIESGTLNRTIYGGSANGVIEGSTNVRILGGTFGNYVFGGGANAGADVYGDTNLHLEDATIEDSQIHGGGAYADVYGNTNVEIISGNYWRVFGGGFEGIVSYAANVTIEGGTFESYTKDDLVYGAHVIGGGYGYEYDSTVGSTNVMISDGIFDTNIFGGGLFENALVEGDTNVTITGGKFGDYHYPNGYYYAAHIYGGGANANADVEGCANVTIENANFTKYNRVFGGGMSGNTVGSTNVVIDGGDYFLVYGGGHEADVIGEAKVTVEDVREIDTILGGGAGQDSSAASTDVTIKKGSLKWIYGGGAEGYVEGEAKITIEGGTFSETIYGGGNLANATVGSTNVTIEESAESSTFRWIYGGGRVGNVTGEAKVTIDGGMFTANIWAGNRTGTVNSTNLTINGGTFTSSWIYGGGWGDTVNSLPSIVTNQAKVTVNGGTFDGGLHGGGQSAQSIVGRTDMTLNSGTFDRICGGGFAGKVIGEAKLTINDGVFNGDVFGGGSDHTATVGSTNLNIKSGTFNHIFGGGFDGKVEGNAVVKIEGGTFDSPINGSGNQAIVEGKAELHLIGGTYRIGDETNKVIYIGWYDKNGVTGKATIYVYEGADIADDIQLFVGDLHYPGSYVGEGSSVKYQIVVKTDGKGMVLTNCEEFKDLHFAEKDKKVILTPGALTYKFDKWTEIEGGITIADDNTFIMPENVVKLKADFIDLPVVDLNIEKTPKKYYYYTNEKLNITDIEVALKYTDDWSRKVVFADFGKYGITTTPSHNSSVGEEVGWKEVVVTHGASGKSTKFEIMVAEAPPLEPIVTKVEVSPAAIQLSKGESAVFTAKVFGENNPTQNVIWSVEGAKGSTRIGFGTLIIGEDETAAELTVIATSALDYTKSGEAIVQVMEYEVPVALYKLTVKNGTGSGRYKKGDIVTITANTASSGERFKEWRIAQSVTFVEGTKRTDKTVKFVMPEEDVTVTAIYEAIGDDDSDREDDKDIDRPSKSTQTEPKKEEPKFEQIGFSDTTTHWAEKDIDFIANLGLISGTSDTTFSPNLGIDRSTFLMALGRLDGTDRSMYQSSSFTDVTNTNPAMPHIEWAVKEGVINGMGDGIFAPDMMITREQMAVMMLRYAKAKGYKLPETIFGLPFADEANISTWAIEAVKAMQKAGIMQGRTDGTFDPKGNLTRAEAATILRRFVELIETYPN